MQIGTKTEGYGASSTSLIGDNAAEASITPICELVNKYFDVFTRPIKLVAQNIKPKNE